MKTVGGLEDKGDKFEDLEDDHDEVEALRMTGRRMGSCTSRYSEPSDLPSLPTPIFIMVTFACFPIIFTQ